MLSALFGVIGPPAVGKALNSVSGIVDRWGESQRIRDEQAHAREMATTEEGRKYLASIHKRDEQGDESLFSRTMCRLYIMFGATMCVFIVACLLLQFQVIDLGPDYAVPIKDPDEKGKSIAFMGLSFNWGTGKIQSISPLGMAYLAYATLSFIITLTATNQRRAR